LHVVAAVVGIAGHVLLLAIWHDPETLSAIRDSGGLDEAFTLPVMLIVPGTVIAHSLISFDYSHRGGTVRS
jgi:hypothetical protein